MNRQSGWCKLARTLQSSLSGRVSVSGERSALLSWGKDARMGSQAARKVDLSRIPLFDSMGEFQIDKPVGDADLRSLRSASCYGDIDGAHVYVDVLNFAALARMTADRGGRELSPRKAPRALLQSTGTSLDLEECY